jgi:membrane carboxypeptidase/penicillin-binding protein
MEFFKWIMTRWKIIFIYIPFCIFLMLLLYSGYIYYEWISDREIALQKLSGYKLLIDRTEEIKKGYPYTRSEVEVGAKVVDIPTRIFDRNNEIIGEFFDEKREIVPFDYIPEWLVKAVIASEDRDFYNHKGISYLGIFRAFIKNIINFRVVQGGSTITQQLAKVLFTDMERNLKRKIYEAYCAVEIEKLYDKQDILSMYLNLIYFGNGSYGVESTSKMFFGTSVRDLDVAESAMIVATISNPRIYSPLSNLRNSVNKTRRILYSLSEAGYINESEVEPAFKSFLKKWGVKESSEDQTLSSRIGSFLYSTYRINRAPFFNEYIRRLLVEKFGDEAVKKGGLSVYTTIDAASQELALKSLRNGISAQREYHIKRASGIKNKNAAEAEEAKAREIEGGMISIDPRSGEIISYAGGYQFTTTSQVDNVSQIMRQPGSSIKPLVYASAIETGKITPSTVFNDKPVTFEKGYAPLNYDKKFYGHIIARQALVKSLNTIAVSVLNLTGYDKVFSYLQKGLDLNDSDFSKRFMKTLSFALGAYELSPIESVRLHSMLVNGGVPVIPYGIKIIKDYSGNTIWDNEKEVQERAGSLRKKNRTIIDPVAARVTLSMLEGVREPGSSIHWLLRKYGINFPCAGKTGTTSDFNDAWFIGYTGDQVTALWIGNRTGSVSLGHGRSASGVAAPVWAQYISGVYKEKSPPDFDSDIEGLTSETICIESGNVAGRNGECPISVSQYYYSGTEPGKFCEIHVTGPVN